MRRYRSAMPLYAPVPDNSIQTGELSCWLALTMPALVVLLAGIEWIQSFSRLLAIGLYIVVICVIFFYVGFFSIAREEQKSKYRSLGGSGIVVFLLACTLISFVAFSQLGRHLYSIWGGFESSSSGYWHWMRFGVANLLESSLLDIPAIYQWKISEVTATAFWSQTFVLLFRTCLQALMIATLLQEMGRVRPKTGQNAGPEPQSYFGFILPGIGTLIVAGFWAVPTALIISGTLAEELNWATIYCSFLLIIILIGGWLILQSLRAFAKLNSIGSRILALLGTVTGIQIITLSWSAFWSVLDA